MDALSLLGLCMVAGLALLGLGTAASLWSGAKAAGRAREDRASAKASGALPPSLHPRIDEARCIGSGSCVKVCPEGDVLAVLDGKAEVVNPTSCIGHGECLRACPVDAIELVLGSLERGVDIPLVKGDFQTDVPGLYVVGELGGMGLIYNAMTQALQCMEGLAAAPPEPLPGGHQLVIVGAGPAGIAASLAAKEQGLDFVTVDQEDAGGTVLQFPRHKIVMTKPVHLPLYGPLKVTEVRKEALLEAWHDIMARTGLQVRTKVKVSGVQRGDDGVFTVSTSEGELRARRVILAMGRRGSPRKLGVPGEDKSKVTYRLVDPEAYEGKRVLVVGGGDSAVEAAVALGEHGADVSLSYRKKSFGRIKKKNKAKLDGACERGDVSLLLQTNVVAIEDDAVRLTGPQGEVSVPNDYVLVFAGGVLPTSFLKAAGVQIETYRGERYAPANV
jgi:thioredoxin reductase/NAD-dependent dihydropyrimidine dehydrogenase PreA subunit